jgi:hypothetical protein
MSFRFREITTPLAVFNQELPVFTSVAASTYAVILDQDLEGHEGRSGNIWYQFGYEFPSSQPGEPEQEQTGSLRESIAVRDAEFPGSLEYAQDFGFFDEDSEKLDALERNTESPIYRGWLSIVALDPANQDEAEEAALNAVRTVQ